MAIPYIDDGRAHQMNLKGSPASGRQNAQFPLLLKGSRYAERLAHR